MLEKLAVSTSPEFRRIISAQSFLQPAWLTATVSGVAASLMLAFLLLDAGALAWLLVQASEPSSIRNGLLPLSEQLQNHVAGSIFARMINAVRLLHSDTSAAAVLISAGAILWVFRSVLRSFAGAVVERRTAELILRLRQHIHRKAIRLEPADLTGEQTRSADRLFQIATLSLEKAASDWGKIWITVLPDLIVAVLIALMTNWRLALQTMIPVVIGRMVLRLEMQRRDASLRLLSEQVDRGLSRMAEGLKKTRIVTSFGMEQKEQQQFESHLGEYQQRCRVMQKQQSLGRGIRNAILLVAIVVPAAILAARILNGDHASIGVMIGCCLIVLFSGLGRTDSCAALATEGSEKAEEIAAYINRIPGVSQAPGAGFLQPMSKTLTFNQISFQTPQLPGLLRGLDLRIGFGETVALLSLQPASARAVASMIPRFLDPDLGQVLIDGRDIRQATLESLRAEAIFVGGQDPVFNATVLENITCGQSDISRQQALDAAKLVHADHFIRTLPKGYETMLGEHGSAMDAGQIFRLSLARAIVRSPALLIIEEPPTSLDAETKAMLDDAYQRISSGRTVIFLPHRLSTVKKCSRIVLIHEGRVAVDGVHDQMVRTSELYRHWEYVRFNPFREESELGS